MVLGRLRSIWLLTRHLLWLRWLSPAEAPVMVSGCLEPTRAVVHYLSTEHPSHRKGDPAPLMMYTTELVCSTSPATSERQLYEINEEPAEQCSIVHMNAPQVLVNSSTGSCSEFGSSVHTGLFSVWHRPRTILIRSQTRGRRSVLTRRVLITRTHFSCEGW